MQIVATPSNVRHIHIFGSQLYISSSSGTSTGVLSVGSGTPTTTGQTATLLATVTNSDSFAVLDVDPNVPGMDTIYIAVDTGGTAGVVNMQKWTFDGSVWTQATFAPTVTGTTVPRTIGLAAWRDGGATHLVVSTVESPARILSIVDDGSTTAPAASVLATAASNTVFRGVARSPTP
jgi:hypothetical protein